MATTITTTFDTEMEDYLCQRGAVCDLEFLIDMMNGVLEHPTNVDPFHQIDIECARSKLPLLQQDLIDNPINNKEEHAEAVAAVQRYRDLFAEFDEKRAAATTGGRRRTRRRKTHKAGIKKRRHTKRR